MCSQIHMKGNNENLDKDHYKSSCFYKVFYVIPVRLQAERAVNRLGSIQVCIVDASTENDLDKIKTKLDDIKLLKGKGYEICRDVLQSRLYTEKTFGQKF